MDYEYNFNSITVKRNQHIILNNVSFNFKKNKMNLLLGRNGVGKSSLLDYISGLTSNNNFFEGKKIIYIMQGVPVLSTAKGKDIVNLITGVNYKKNIHLSYLKEFLSADEYKQMKTIWNQQFDHLSLGQRRWLTIISFLLINADVYLLDEPTAGIDIENTKRLFTKIKNKIEMGSTVIMTTHEDSDISSFRDAWIVHLKDTKIDFEGSTTKYEKESRYE